MGIISWIILGALAGWVASLIMKTDGSMGAVANIIVGIVGAFIGGLVMSLIGKVGVTAFDIRSFLVALLCAVIQLAIVKALRRIVSLWHQKRGGFLRIRPFVVPGIICRAGRCSAHPATLVS